MNEFGRDLKSALDGRCTDCVQIAIVFVNSLEGLGCMQVLN